MSVSWSLRNRVASALALFGTAISLSLATLIYLASLDLEASLIDDTLTAELDDFIARRQRNPHSLPEKTATIRAYVVNESAKEPAVPPPVRRLLPGQHHLVLDDIHYRAAARQVGTQRFVVLYDTSTLRQREHGLLMLLAGSVLLVTALSAMVGRWLAARMIAPVTELAQRVANLRPEDEPTPLADQFPWIEVRHLAANFDGYLSRLHEFIQREQLFTGDVSHELRTPLSVINGATELLMTDTSLDEPQRKRIARIARAVGEMSRITSALLALAREKGENSNPSVDCDCMSVIRGEIESYQTLFRHKPVTLSLDIQGIPEVKVDHAIMSMVLGNLLRNALSFTEQGEVTVRIDSHSLSVEDSGPGLDGLNPQQLLKPYMRSDRSKGTGIGLSLVLRLCERQGWRLILGDRPEGGAVATIQLTPEPVGRASG